MKHSGRDVLINLSLSEHGDWDKIYEIIRAKRPIGSWEEYEEKKAAIKSEVITILDEDFPFKQGTSKPPFVLYYYGDISLLKNPANNVSYVGSRKASDYGKKMARSIAGDLAAYGKTIVSGLAKGIDAEATRAALDNGGKAVAVLGCGIDLCYPSENEGLYERLKTHGLIISEYPLLTPPKPEFFLRRNRLIASSSNLLIVGEAKRRSGTLVTVSHALEAGKDVACLPFAADRESGCNELIKQGAYLIESAADALSIIGEAPSPKIA